jgi:hypothetical protein
MTIEAMKRWLECAERCESLDGKYSWADVIFTIKEAIEQAQKQEPVAIVDATWNDDEGFVLVKRLVKNLPKGSHLYASPPQRQWVGLTDEDKNQVAWSCGAMSADWIEFAEAIEAKLKQKNGYAEEKNT